VHTVLRGGAEVGRWTCDLQVTGSIPSRSAFTQHRLTWPCISSGSLNRVPASAGGKSGIHTTVGCHPMACELSVEVKSRC